MRRTLKNLRIVIEENSLRDVLSFVTHRHLFSMLLDPEHCSASSGINSFAKPLKGNKSIPCSFPYVRLLHLHFGMFSHHQCLDFGRYDEKGEVLEN